MRAAGTTRAATAEVHIHVCVTCRPEGEPLEPRERAPGARLYAALASALADDPQIRGVECLSVCKRPCTVCFAAPGKWTYVYGDLPPTPSRRHPRRRPALCRRAGRPDPLEQRPDALKKGVVARLPPTEPAA